MLCCVLKRFTGGLVWLVVFIGGMGNVVEGEDVATKLQVQLQSIYVCTV